MSTLATHALIGLLLGLALRLEPRHLPIAAGLPLVADLDHLGLFSPIDVFASRVTFHNVFVLVAVPLAAFVVLEWYRFDDDLRDLAAKAPVILVSAALTDMVSFDAPALGAVALYHPLDPVWYTWRGIEAATLDPLAFSTMTLAFVVMAGMTVATVLFVRRRPRRRDRWSPEVRWGWMAAFVAAWLVVLPALTLAGAIVPTVRTPSEGGVARMEIRNATGNVTTGRVVANVTYHVTAPAPAGTLSFEVMDEEGAWSTLENPPLDTGSTWRVRLAVEGDPCRLERSWVRVAPANRFGTQYWRISAPLDVEGVGDGCP